MAQLELRAGIETSHVSYMQDLSAGVPLGTNSQTLTEAQIDDSQECDSYTAHRLVCISN